MFYPLSPIHCSYIWVLHHRQHYWDFTMIPHFLPPPWQVFMLEQITAGIVRERGGVPERIGALKYLAWAQTPAAYEAGKCLFHCAEMVMMGFKKSPESASKYTRKFGAVVTPWPTWLKAHFCVKDAQHLPGFEPTTLSAKKPSIHPLYHFRRPDNSYFSFRTNWWVFSLEELTSAHLATTLSYDEDLSELGFSLSEPVIQDIFLINSPTNPKVR